MEPLRGRAIATRRASEENPLELYCRREAVVLSDTATHFEYQHMDLEDWFSYGDAYLIGEVWGISGVFISKS